MTDKTLDGFVRVARLQDIPAGQARTFEIGDDSVALCNVEGVIYAINNICSHDDGPLGDGTLDAYEIECPRHGARFDVRSGAVTAMPAAVGVDTFETIINGDDIYVKFDQ